MLKILEFIFESPIHYFGTLILIWVTCYGLSMVTEGFRSIYQPIIHNNHFTEDDKEIEIKQED